MIVSVLNEQPADRAYRWGYSYGLNNPQDPMPSDKDFADFDMSELMKANFRQGWRDGIAKASRPPHFMNDVCDMVEETGCDWSTALAFYNVD